jgi:hypothetical protein
MANKDENRVLREYGNRKKRYKRRRNIIILTLLLLLVVVGGAYLLNLYNRSYKNYKVMKSTEIKGENAVGYLSYGSSIVKYGKDGVQSYDKDGRCLWNSAYEMSDPIADSCGKYIVIADKGSKSIHIYDGKTEVGSFSTDYEIEKVEIASQGVVAVLMTEGDTSHIVMYDKEGNIKAEKVKTLSETGLPLDIALSEDGTKLAVNCMVISKGEAASEIGFYNFGEVGKNAVNNFTGGFRSDTGILAPRVEFLNNDTACVYKDNGFAIFSVKEWPTDEHEESLKGKVQSIFYNKNYTGLILQSEDGLTKHLLLYDLKGKKVLDKILDFEYKKIYMADDEIILYNDLTCIVMKPDGKIKFKGTFDSNIMAFYPINHLDRYFLASEKKLMDIQLSD